VDYVFLSAFEYDEGAVRENFADFPVVYDDEEGGVVILAVKTARG
jgi:hypothetical protein